jgi:streptogrisin C
VVRSDPGQRGAAADFVARAGVDNSAVRIEPSTSRLAPMNDLLGANATDNDSDPNDGEMRPHCSTGFPVVGGFLIAGHCGAAGSSVYSHLVTNGSRVKLGTVQASDVEPFDDAWVASTSAWTPLPRVNSYPGFIAVDGAQPAPVFGSVCRSGAVSHVKCGSITAYNVTVNLEFATITGLTKTSACSERGDSGGPYLWGSQAQGILSIGHENGDCGGGSSGDESFFQPVNRMLARFHLTLRTTSGGGVPPFITDFECWPGSINITCDVAEWPVATQIRWRVNGTDQPAMNNKHSASFRCPRDPQNMSVVVTVSNAAGSVSKSVGVECEGRSAG